MVGEAFFAAATEAIKEAGEKIAETAKEIAETVKEGESIFPDFFQDVLSDAKEKVFSNLDSMKKDLGKTYGEIKENKPPNSPNIAKWFDEGGSVKIEEAEGRQVWTYIDDAGREVPYVEGYPKFPPEAKHPVIDDIDIGKFTGDREKDKELYLTKLEDQYGLAEVPDGYRLHHDSTNGNLQLVKTDWHEKFRHMGGHGLFKED